MKKIFVVLFILLISLFFAFINSESKTEKPPSSPKNSEETNVPIPIKDSYYSLWEDEAKSKTLNPSNLDSIKKGETSNHYDNHYLGYSFDYPNKWNIDNHQVPNYTRFYGMDFRIDITAQNLKKIWVSKETFYGKTLEPLKKYITNDRYININGHSVREVHYKRKPIKGIEHDLTNYAYYFVSSGDVVYTFQLKTSEAEFQQKQNELEELISTITFHTRKDIDITKIAKNADKINPNIYYKHEKNSLVIPPNHFMMGVYTPNSRDIVKLNEKLNTHLGVQMFYKPVNSDYDIYVKEMADEKRLPIVTFLFQKESETDVFDIVEQIINGNFDDKIMDWATEVKKVKSPVMLRIGNEMNGYWSEWSHKYTYNDPDLYKMSYRHYVNVFRSIKVENAYFIWNPNNIHAPYYEWNNAAMYYPGDNFVDWVGLTAYNFGKTKFEDFKTFDDAYEDLYFDYLRAYTSKPMIIGEFGSVEYGGDKAEFINNAFEKIPTKYPNIKLAVWFDEKHADFNLKINTSKSSTNAFKNGMQQDNVIKYLD